MATYLTRRLAQAAVVVLGVTVVSFLLLHLLPGSLAHAIIGPRATSQQIAIFSREYGLDKPLAVQYLTWLWHLLHGNLGYSYKLNESVDSIIEHALPKDILLVGTSLALAVAIAIPLGVAQAVRRNGFMDYAGTGVSFILYSMPSFWLGIILIDVFAISLGWFPAEAPQGATITQVLAQPQALVLPIATFTLINYAVFSRYMRSSAIESLAQDYIRTARAKGLPERLVRYRHMLRNSLIPIATLIGLSLPAVITAGLIVESVFNFPGLGYLFLQAAGNEDIPILLGVTVLVGVATVVGSLLADVAYAILDPRVRYS